jgi:hypothetical protein
MAYGRETRDTKKAVRERVKVLGQGFVYRRVPSPFRRVMLSTLTIQLFELTLTLLHFKTLVFPLALTF